ncbi:hypothetical protein HanIR_Chr06g0298331 [Helianthus annuus]|nr:hypothetical protein HanIR_Chr06g0298331 [Helianthus annuus]
MYVCMHACIYWWPLCCSFQHRGLLLHFPSAETSPSTLGHPNINLSTFKHQTCISDALQTM